MLNRRPPVPEYLRSTSWLRSHVRQLIAAVGLFAVSPQVADAVRKGERRDGNKDRNDTAKDDGNDGAETNERERGSDQHSEGKAGAEDRNASDESQKTEKRDRDDRRGDDEERRDKGDAESEKSRDESSRRDGDSDSRSAESASEDDESSQGGGRRVRELEQQADDPADETPAPTTVTPANPNVEVGDIPTTSIADLVVEANDDVIATVSASGGFAFARSDDVIAVTGPDGATIIQTGDVSTGTRDTDPTEPSDDGGNNDMDFTS